MNKAVEILFLKAKNAEKQGNRAEAVRLYRNILDQFPANDRAQKALTQLLAQQQQQQQQQASDPSQDLPPPASGLKPGPLPKAIIDELAGLLQSRNAAAVIARVEALVPQYLDAAPLLEALGKAYLQMERAKPAANAFAQAISLQPDHAEAHFHLGTALLRQGKAKAALAVFRKTATLMPDYPGTYLNIANALKELGRPEEAVDALRQALAIKPDFMEALFNLANTLKSQGKLDEAIDTYRAAIALRPDFMQAHHNLGNACRDAKRMAEAAEAYHQTVRLAPEFGEGYQSLGNALLELGLQAEAVVALRKAVELRPGEASTLFCLGSALGQSGHFDEAISLFEKTLTIEPGRPDVYNNYATVLLEAGRTAEAGAAYAKVIALAPDHSDGQFNTGVVSLLQGDFATGLPLYEWRRTKTNPVVIRDFAMPLWLGKEPLAGKSILVHCEQGLGDTIQFIRYARLLHDQGARVAVSVQDVVLPLLSGFHPGITVIGTTVTGQFDYHVPLLSLPLALGTRLETVPATIPYLHADPARVDIWRDRIGSHGFRIGICWQGNPTLQNPRRAFGIEMLAGLGALPGVRLISLHKGQGLSQLADLPPGMRVESLGDDFDEPQPRGPGAFIDTAAVMTLCDLVVTLDTSVAHLAGALGVPVWVALKHAPDWRWLLDREDSPWYPSMRLFRQDSPGDWASIFARIEAAAAPLAALRLAERQSA